MKRKWQDICMKYIKKAKAPVLREPVTIQYVFHEANKRRDHDNVSGFAHKVIQDAMVASGIIKNDGWNNINGYADDFVLDKSGAYVEVIVWEATDGRCQMDKNCD